MNVDVAIIGAGPAGSTAARLLAQRAYSVALIAGAERREPRFVESLPPSTRKLFRFLGILDRIDAAGFCRATGNTVWWGGTEQRVERFSGTDGTGYQVPRGAFDELLLTLAEKAGAGVHRNCVVKRVELKPSGRGAIQCDAGRIEARWLLDCSGRAGVIARRFRRRQRKSYTVAIARIWRRDGGWRLADDSHTLVESYRHGWAWSAPFDPGTRYFTVMVDGRVSELERGRGLERMYQAEIQRTTAFQKLLEGATPASDVWSCDASLYFAAVYGGEQFLLVGDAATFIDPLSSYGVKKALMSAYMAAAVVNTSLKRSEMREVAIAEYSGHERYMYYTHLSQGVRHFASTHMLQAAGFWRDRSEFTSDPDANIEGDEETLKRDPEVKAAFQMLRQSLGGVVLSRSDSARIERTPELRPGEIVLADALAGGRLVAPMRYLAGVDLPLLADIADKLGDVGRIVEAYSRVAAPTPLPALMFALSVLVGKGLLIQNPR